MKTVVLCGSRRFKEEIRSFAKTLKEAGVTVYEPYLHSGVEGVWDTLTTEYQNFIYLGLTHDHFYKIDMADLVYVYNKDGYSGVSTTLEIGYAVAAKKPIYAFSLKDEEGCRCVLFRKQVSTPEELLPFLL